ncbi:MAG TPA: BamA/TamA family outer membrane protein, partial [Anaeromyxobacteraceae bacterium]|nr:BamA/TamA family outer membrane protein [Anaeromyxobacteraceae bacterium]
YDPRLTWRTVETEHFRVHYHDGLDALARRVAAAGERAHAALVPQFAHAPRGRTEVVVSDDVEDANGSATPLPYNTIRVYAVPPDPFSELDDQRDWVEALVGHEYVHILHLDTVEGLPAAVNAVFGKVLTPAAFGPALLTEGFAVLHEGELPGPGEDGGRNRNALFDMYARALTLEGPFPRLDETVHQPLTWPRGNMAYLLGGRFLEWARARSGVGPAGLTAFTKDQGSQVWPWRFQTLSERHLGEPLSDLWREFGASVRSRAEAEVEAVRARGATGVRRLTWRGSVVANPRWLPGGDGIVYLDRGTEERPGLRRVALSGADGGRLVAVDANGAFALRGSGEAVVAATDYQREWVLRDDLYLADLGSGCKRQVTSGERASDPDVARDGVTVVYAAHLPGGETALKKLRLDGGDPETLWSAPGAQVATPRWSPDGRRVAFAIQQAGRWDVAVWEGGEVAFVTDDDAIELAPSWSPDGRTIYFASERTGIYDVYAYELEEAPSSPETTEGRRHLPGRLWQVTDVELGVFQPEPSPDGSTLALLTYSRLGYDLAVLPVDRTSWREPAPARARPLRGPEAPALPPPPELPDRPYRALDTILPTFWLPLLGGDPSGLTVGAITGGTDVLVRHAYVLQAWYGVESGEPGYAANYVGTWLYPRLSLSSSRAIGTTGGEPSFPEERWVPIALNLAFTKTHVDRAYELDLGYRVLRLRSLGGTPEVVEPGASPYQDGTATEASLGLTYSDVRRYVSSISREEGRVVGLSFRLASPALGGSFTYSRARAAAAQYLPLPLVRHAVLALRGSFGLASGTIGGRQPFTLGGPAPTDLASLVLSPLLGPTLPPDLLRGYPTDAFTGSTLVSGTIEARFPLARLERGVAAWPLQVRRLYGSAFLDGGGAFPALGDPAPPGTDRLVRFGAGVELAAEVVLGYAFRTDVRLGVARGLGPLFSSGAPPDPLATTQVYVAIGPSF